MLNAFKEKYKLNASGIFMICALFATLVTLTFFKVGSAAATGVLGMILCAAGLFNRGFKPDMVMFVLMLFYTGWGAVSSLVRFHTITDGYFQIWIIYPLMYLLLSSLDEDKRKILSSLICLYAVIFAGYTVINFAYKAAAGIGSGREGSVIGGANAAAMFFVLAWFLLQDIIKKENKFTKIIAKTEPLVLCCLALTLSMGAYLALIAGIITLIIKDGKQFNGGRINYAMFLIAKAAIPTIAGIILYLAGYWCGAAWLSLIVVVYIAFLCFFFDGIAKYFKENRKVCAAVLALSVLAVIAVIIMRPNAPATFAERFEMMDSGFYYGFKYPLFGVGPYTWRVMDSLDGGTLFNTWHVHNIIAHSVAEFGVPAMAAVILIIVRYFFKKHSGIKTAQAAAFLVHNLIDTSFFYMVNASFLILTAADPREKGRELKNAAVKVILCCFLAFFVYDLIVYYYARL